MLNAIKPSKKTVILYLLVPVVLFIFTVIRAAGYCTGIQFLRVEGRSQEDLHWNCQL